MSLDEDLKAKGYEAFSPVVDTKVFPTLKGLIDIDKYRYLDGRKIRDLQIVQGLLARKDLREYPDLYLIYILPENNKKKE